jgi:hypothetical protein
MLNKSINHFSQCKTHVLEADLLAHDIERHGGITVVHGAHDACQNASIANARIKDAQGWRSRINISQFLRDSIGYLPLLAAGVNEKKVFLAVVVKEKILIRVDLAARRQGREIWRRAPGRAQRQRHSAFALLVTGHERVDLVERIGRDPTAVSQSRHQLSVIDGRAAECGFGKSGFLAKLAYFHEQLFCAHALVTPPSPHALPGGCAIFSRPTFDATIKSAARRMGGKWALAQKLLRSDL